MAAGESAASTITVDDMHVYHTAAEYSHLINKTINPKH